MTLLRQHRKGRHWNTRCVHTFKVQALTFIGTCTHKYGNNPPHFHKPAWDPAARWGGGKKHEIYVAAFGGHLFYDLFLQGLGGGHGPLGTPLDPLLQTHINANFVFTFLHYLDLNMLVNVKFRCQFQGCALYWSF